MPPEPQSPLGTPLRVEEWYVIGNELISCKLTVYPGELIAVSEREYGWLKGERVDPNAPPGEPLVIRYPELKTLLVKNGFVRFET